MIVFAGNLCIGEKYLVIVFTLGGGSGGGGGRWFLVLPTEILGKLGLGLMLMLFLTHSLTPDLNFSSFGSVLRLPSNMLNNFVPL